MILLALSTVLTATVIAGLWRILIGPSHGDRLMAIQLFGSCGAALLLLLAHTENVPALREAALILALLASVVSAALVQYLRRRPGPAVGQHRAGDE